MDFNFDKDDSCSAPVICETPFGLMMTTVERVLLDNHGKEPSPPISSSTTANFAAAPATTTAGRINPFRSNPNPTGLVVDEKHNLSDRPSIFSNPKQFSRKRGAAGSNAVKDDASARSAGNQRVITLPSPVVLQFITTNHSRTKVFSGNTAKSSTLKIVKSLSKLSTTVVQNNLESLVGYDKLPRADLLNVLKMGSVMQLQTIEKNNPGICEAANEVWKFHYDRDFRGFVPMTDQWRDAYKAAKEHRRMNLQDLTKRARIAVETKSVMKPAKLKLDDEGFMDTFKKADCFFLDRKGNRKRAGGIKRSFQ